jgi:hypothetical protein
MNAAEHVAAERGLRGLSVRAAANLTPITNTTWAKFEKTGHVTDAVRKAVAQAFGWPTSWPESLPPLTQLHPGEPSASELKALIEQLIAEVERMGASIETLVAQSPDMPVRAGRSVLPADGAPAKPSRV